MVYFTLKLKGEEVQSESGTSKLIYPEVKLQEIIFSGHECWLTDGIQAKVRQWQSELSERAMTLDDLQGIKVDELLKRMKVLTSTPADKDHLVDRHTQKTARVLAEELENYQMQNWIVSENPNIPTDRLG